MHHKIKLIIITILTIASCKNNNRPVIQQNKTTKHPESVVIIDKDTTSFLVNFTTNDYAIEVKNYLLNNKKDGALVVLTDSIVNLFLLNNYRYRLHFKFIKGDTIIIESKTIEINHESIQYPFFTEKHNRLNPYELNFDYYVSLKTPTLSTYPYYEGHYQFLNRNIEEYKREKIKFNRNDVYNSTKRMLDSFFKLKRISQIFYKQQLKMITLDKAQLELFKAIKLHQKIDIDTIGFSIKDETLKHNQTYLWYLENLIKYRYFFDQKSVSSSELFDFINTNNTFLNITLKEALLGKLLSEIYNSDKKTFKIKAVEFANITHNKSAKDFLGKLVKSDSIDKVFTTKNVDSEKEITGLNNKQYNLKTLILNEKGKVILVDFWASWCVPCIKEFPYLKKLHQDLKDSVFNIISISTDNSYTSWKNRLQLENLDAISSNYIINTKKSEIKKTYNILTIPRYLLFDKQGVLVNKNASRPSDKKLKALILKLINAKK